MARKLLILAREPIPDRLLASQIGVLTSITTDLAGVSRHLVNVQGELVESNSLLRQLVESHDKRLDHLEGESLN